MSTGDTLETCKKMARASIKAVLERAVRDGLLTPEDAREGMYQALWRGWRRDGWGDVPMDRFDMNDALTAVLDALLHQGGVAAWAGDGTSCVAQMIELAYRDRDKWRERALAAERLIPQIAIDQRTPLCPKCGKPFFSIPRLGISHACPPDNG